MKLNLILVSSTILLINVPAFAADADDSGIKSYAPTKKSTSARPVAAATGGRMQIPPPPVETLPGHAAPPAASTGRPETVKTAIDTTVTTVGTGTALSKNDQVQRFATYLELKPGMENAPLTMHLSNQGFKWFRLLIANQVVATEKSLSGKTEADLDLTGIIQSGTNQVVIQAGGVPGSKIEWKVTTPSVAHIDKLDPGDEVLVGSDLKIKGKNFSASPSKDVVLFNTKKGQVTKARASELGVKVPPDAEIGENKVSVKVGGVESNKVKIIVRGIPEISGTSLQGCPPGQTIIVFGKNFSKNTGENKVFFDDTPGAVTGGSTTQLSVQVPFIPQRAEHAPSNIKVQVGKIMSANSFPVQIGPQMYSDPGVGGGNDVPTYDPRTGISSPNGTTIVNP